MIVQLDLTEDHIKYLLLVRDNRRKGTMADALRLIIEEHENRYYESL